MTTPAGVEHYVTPRGACVTCGRDHLDLHGRTVRRYSDQYRTPSCDVVQAYGAWPYDCDARRADPDALISVCQSHGVWWVATEYDFR